MKSTITLHGKKVKFSHNHVLQTITFTAEIVRDTHTVGGERRLLLKIPKKVYTLKFPPFMGQKFVWVKYEAVKNSLILS